MVELDDIEDISVSDIGTGPDVQLEITTTNGWYCYGCSSLEAKTLKELLDTQIRDFKEQQGISTLALILDDILFEVNISEVI